MIECPECGASISESAKACPKCGSTKHRKSIWPWVVGIPVGLFVIFIGYGMTIPEYQHTAREQREVCYKLAAYNERFHCDRLYSEAIERGKASK